VIRDRAGGHRAVLEQLPQRLSSFLGPIEGAGAFVAGYVLARRHNCHVKGCMRIGRSPVRGTQFVVCRRHHPLDAPSHGRARRARRRAGRGDPTLGLTRATCQRVEPGASNVV
jgi:hypothetical protein